MRYEPLEPALAARAEQMWQLIDRGGRDEDLSKLVSRLKAPDRRRLMTTPRVQWAETPDASRMTPLMAAIAGGNLAMARVLVEAGRPSSLIGLQEAGTGPLSTRTPLLVAAMYGNVDALDLLVGPAMGDDIVRQLVEARPVPATTLAWLRGRHPEPDFFRGALYQACERDTEQALASLDPLVEHGGVRLADFPDLMAIALAGRQFGLALALLDRGLSPALDISLAMQQFSVKGRKWAPLKPEAVGGHGASVLALTLMYGCQRAFLELPDLADPHSPRHFELRLPADVGSAALDERRGDERHRLVAHILGGKGFNRPRDVDDRLLTGLVLSGDARGYAALAHSELFWPGTAQVAHGLLELASRRRGAAASDLTALLHCQMRVLHLREQQETRQPPRPRLGRLLGRAARAPSEDVPGEIASALYDVNEMIEVIEGGGSQISDELAAGLRIDPQSQAMVAAAAQRPSLGTRLALAVGRGQAGRQPTARPMASASRPTRLLLSDR